MQKLVKDGKLGAKSGGEGFYKDGEPNIEGDGDVDEKAGEELADLFILKSLVEACKLLEEGVSTVREIDLGMMAGAGLDPRRGLFPPFWKADLEGLDTMLEKLEKYEASHGERFAPPRILKRLVAQGRLGLKSGQGFYAYPQGGGDGAVKLEKRADGVAIAWLANPPMNAISPDVIGDLGKVWEQVKADDEVKAMVIYSSLPVVYSAGADIKAFSKTDEPREGGRADRRRPRAAARAGPVERLDGRGRERDRLRRRLRAGDGLRLPGRGRLGGVRPARDQPRDHPRLRRHPAPGAAGRPLEGAGDEPDR